jgi:perosamine synthetase
MKTPKIPSAGPSITKAEIKLVTEAVTHGWYENRNMHVNQFVKEFSDYTNIKYCYPTTNCTSAIHLALLAAGIGPGDEVIVPDVTWVASVAPIHYVGATPVFADIEENSWCLSPEAFEKAITKKTKAVIIVDLYGNMPKWDELLKIAKKNKVIVIEDAAEAMGAEYKGRKAGSFGDISAFSFNATKIMIAGHGGMVATNNKKWFDRFEILAHHGMLPYNKKTFWSVEIGYNYLWTNIQAALALAQLRRIDELVNRKRKIFRWYKKRLEGIEGISLNEEAPETRSTFWIINARLSGEFKIDKEKIMDEFKKYKIDTRPFFYPVSSQPAYAKYVKGKNYRKINKISYSISPYIISLPYSLELKESDVEYVCGIFIKILKKLSRS